MFKNYSATEFEKGIKEDANAVILDVRTAAEFQGESIPGAVNIDFMAGDFTRQVNELDPSKNYYVYCRSGARSASACSVLFNNGFENIINLSPGIPGWTGKLKRA